MKTVEQNKQEVINYLDKTTSHLFLKPKATFKWGDQNKPGYYEYDYENGTYFKLFKKEDGYYLLENDSVRKIDVENYIKYNGNNAKCVISHMLFLNKKMKSIKMNRNFLIQSEELLKKFIK